MNNFYVVLLHENMVDKQGTLVTTSLTMIDVHDIARSAATFGVAQTFFAHPAEALRSLARTLKNHWEDGFGATYNPNRKEALSSIQIVASLEDVIAGIHDRHGVYPKLIGTSARKGDGRLPYDTMKKILAETPEQPYLLMFGTGWGMSDELMKKTELLLEPICGPTDYNHLSVRSACAIILDRLFGS